MTKNEKPQNVTKRHKSTTKETKTLSTDCSTAGLKASSGA